jgi:hypothetical protein
LLVICKYKSLAVLSPRKQLPSNDKTWWSNDPFLMLLLRGESPALPDIQHRYYCRPAHNLVTIVAEISNLEWRIPTSIECVQDISGVAGGDRHGGAGKEWGERHKSGCSMYISQFVPVFFVCVCVFVCWMETVDTQHCTSTSYANLMGDEWHILGREGLSLFSFHHPPPPSFFLFIVFLYHHCDLTLGFHPVATILLIKKYRRMVSIIESDRGKMLFYIHLHTTQPLVQSNWIGHYSWAITQNDKVFCQQDVDPSVYDAVFLYVILRRW